MYLFLFNKSIMAYGKLKYFKGIFLSYLAIGLSSMIIDPNN